MADEYVVELEKICRCYDEEYFPEYVQKLPEGERARHTFVIRACSEGDVIALLNAEATTSTETEEGTGRVRILVTADQKLKWWIVRRFVRPPEALKECWEKDELDMRMPPDLLRDLWLRVMAKIRPSMFALPEETPPAVERAALKK